MGKKSLGSKNKGKRAKEGTTNSILLAKVREKIKEMNPLNHHRTKQYQITTLKRKLTKSQKPKKKLPNFPYKNLHRH